jgi:hypothetical protein
MSIAAPAIAETPPPPGEAPAPAAPPASAAELAARIPVPVRLPARRDGEPIRHLSATSYGLWLVCREAWRRKYICREREAPSGAMFLGSRVDDAVSLYYQRRLAGEQLDPEQVKDAYREHWRQQLDTEREQLGIDWSDIHPVAAFEIGLQALDMTSAQLVPKLGAPVAVQRRVEYTISPGIDWTILCYLDLETRGRDLTGAEIPRVVDYKSQGLDHQPSPGRPRPSSQPVHGRPMATGQPRRRVLLRPDRQARHMWKSTYSGLCCSRNYVACHPRCAPKGGDRVV